jgi:hypothetical protein
MRRVRSLLLAIAPCLAGCYSAPELDAPKGPVHGLQRLLSPDLSTSSAAARARSARSALSTLAAEPARVAGITATAGALAGGAEARATSLPSSTAALAGAELARRPPADTLAGLVLRAPDEAARRIDEGLDPSLLGVDRRPLGEIDDSRHRTDPGDLHPEATFWQRLRRRLRL